MEIKAELMMPIPIDDLVNGVKIPCDILCALGHSLRTSGQCWCLNGGRPAERISNLKKSTIFGQQKGLLKIVHQSTSLAGVIVNRKDVADHKKADFLTKAAGTVMRQIDNVGLDLNSYGTARHVSEAVFLLAEHHSGLSQLL